VRIVTAEESGRFEIPQDMRNMAEASFDQARKAFEGFLTAAQTTVSKFGEQGLAARASTQEISSKAISYAEKNVTASLDYANNLLKAKDVSEIMRLHSEYVQAQMQTLAQQASELGQTVVRVVQDGAKPK
jgi:phasin